MRRNICPGILTMPCRLGLINGECFCVRPKQERWAVPGAELVSSKEIPFKGAAQGTGDATAAAAGSDNGEDGLDDSVGGAKRFLPFSTGPRQ